MSLNLKHLVSQNGYLGDRGEAVVEVPEFGEGMTVNVRALTVGDRGLLGQAGANPTQLEHSAMCIVTAVASFDDKGNLVFGVTKGDAIRRVEDLPERYAPAVSRISMAAMHLTAGHAVDRRGRRVDAPEDAPPDGEEARPLDEKASIEEAEKN